MDRSPLGDEACARASLGHVVVLLVGDHLELIGPGLDRGGFKIGGGIRMMGLDEADMVEQELVAARRPENPFLEEDP